MSFKVGDKCVVRLGEHRGHHYECGWLPSGMLPDGTVVTIRAVEDPKRSYSFILEDNIYGYPLSLLYPVPTKKIKLLQALKGGLYVHKG